MSQKYWYWYWQYSSKAVLVSVSAIFFKSSIGIGIGNTVWPKYCYRYWQYVSQILLTCLLWGPWDHRPGLPVFCILCLFILDTWLRVRDKCCRLQRVLHRASSRGFTPYYYDLDTLAKNAHYHVFFATAAAKLIVSIICTQLNLGHLAPCGWEPVVISLNCLLLSMNSTIETLLFDRF